MGVPPSAALAYLGRDQAAGRAAYGMGLADDELARQVLGDAWFVAPARWLAARTAGGAPSYLYHFDYVAAARRDRAKGAAHGSRSGEHTSEHQAPMSISYAVFSLKKKK